MLIFHRHGDRTPVLDSIDSKVRQTPEEKSFWAAQVATPQQLELLQQTAKPVGADPSQPPTISPPREAQFPNELLTQKGVQQMIGKGRHLRERYGAFVGHDVKSDDVYVLSSNVPRTIESVQSLLRGFFYDGRSETDQDEVPLFYVRTYTRNVLAPTHSTTFFNDIERLVRDDIEQTRSTDERERLERLRLHLCKCFEVPTDLSWTAARDVLVCRDAHGWPLPDGLDGQIVKQVAAYEGWLWGRLYCHKDFCYGAFRDGVQEVYSFLKSVATVDPKQTAKLSFFSAHDNSIVALLSALQVDTGSRLPEYGTAVAFEVYEDVVSREFFIQVLYEDDVVLFDGCANDSLCSFSHFESLALDFLGRKD